MISTKINVDTSGILKAFDMVDKEGKVSADYLKKVFSDNIVIEVNDNEIKNLPKQAKKSFDEIDNEAKGLFANLKSSLNLGSILNFASGQIVADGIAKVGEGLGFLAEQASRADEIGTQLENGFRLAGLSGAELDKQLQETTKFARDFGFELGVAPERIKELSATAGGLGGATGKMNQDLTKLAIGIENATGGAINGEKAIQIFSRGISDPENAEAIDKLKKQFPLLGDALLTASSPAEKLDASMKVLSGTFETMKNDTSDVEARFGIFKMQIAEGAQAIGGAFLSSFNTDKLLEFFGSMGGGVDIFKVLENAGTILGQTLTNVLNVLIDITKQITSSPVFQFLASNIELVTTAIITYIAYQKAMTIEMTASELKTKAVATAQGIYNGIVAFGNGILSTAKTVMLAYSNGTVIATAKTYLMNTAQTLLNAIMSANPIGLVVVALGALTAGLVYAYKNSEAFRKVIDSVWETMKGWLKSLGMIVTKVLEFLGILGKDTNIKKNVKIEAEVDTKSFNDLNNQINNLIKENDGSGKLKLKVFENTENAIKRNIEEQKKLGKITNEQYQQLIKNLDSVDYKQKAKEQKEKKEKEHVETLQDLYKKLYDETEKLAIKQDFGNVYQNNIVKLKELQKEIEKEKTAKLNLEFVLNVDLQKKIQNAIDSSNIDLEIRPKEFKFKELPKIELPENIAEILAYEVETESDKLIKDSVKNIIDGFNKIDYTSIFKKKETAFDESLNEDRANLLTSLQQNEISYEEYSERLNEIDRNRRETQKEGNSEFINGLNQTLALSFENSNMLVSNSLSKSFEENSKKLQDLEITSEQFTTNITDNIGVALGGVMLATAQAGLEGRDLLKSLLINTIDAATAMVNAWAGALFVKEMTEKPFGTGALTYAAYMLGANALLGIGRAYVNSFKDGVINLQGAGTSRSDSIPAMLSKGESVINARSTAQNEPYLRFINNGGDMSKLVNMNMNTKNIENLLYTNNELLRSKNFNPSINNVNKFNVSSSSIKVVRGR